MLPFYAPGPVADRPPTGFGPKFDAGEPITQCFIAAAPADGATPAGVDCDGGYADPNPYDYYDGKPLQFVQD